MYCRWQEVVFRNHCLIHRDIFILFALFMTALGLHYNFSVCTEHANLTRDFFFLHFLRSPSFCGSKFVLLHWKGGGVVLVYPTLHLAQWLSAWFYDRMFATSGWTHDGLVLDLGLRAFLFVYTRSMGLRRLSWYLWVAHSISMLFMEYDHAISLCFVCDMNSISLPRWYSCSSWGMR